MHGIQAPLPVFFWIRVVLGYRLERPDNPMALSGYPARVGAFAVVHRC